MTATAGLDVPTRRLHPAGPSHPDVVVRLHRQTPLRPRRPEPDQPSAHGAAPDLDQLARAVHALVGALAPGIVAEVSVLDDEPAPSLAGAPSPATAEHGPSVIGDEHIQLDRLSRTLLVDGEPVALTKREFELLAHLAQHRGVAMSRRELMNAVWHERYLPGDRTVDVHVRRVRVKLGSCAERLSTLRGFGYRFD